MSDFHKIKVPSGQQSDTALTGDDVMANVIDGNGRCLSDEKLRSPRGMVAPQGRTSLIRLHSRTSPALHGTPPFPSTLFFIQDTKEQ